MTASCPDSWVSRFAARPVGAARTIFAPLAAARVTIDRTVKLFPQPGPPVSTATFSVNANRTAAACSGANSIPVRRCNQPNARSQSTPANPGNRSASVRASARS